LTLRVTVGDVAALPVNGTFSVSSGTTQTLPYYTNVAGLQNALNNLANINSVGGVTVDPMPTDGGTIGFLVANKATGATGGFTVDPALLVPDCTAELSVLTTGATGVRQLTSLILKRTKIAQTETWASITSPYNGWSGTLAIDSAAALEFIRLNGQPAVDGSPIVEAQTLLTVETIDASGNSTPRYQTPILLRALNYGTAAASADMQKDFFAKPNITALASNVASSTALGGLTTADGTYPVGGTVQCLFTNDVVANWIRKSSTANQSVPFIVRPYDYNGTNNAYQWIIDRVTKGGQPCVWNSDTSLWHYEAANGNANAVSIAMDQTGFALPA
jgi:hypothetical protein